MRRARAGWRGPASTAALLSTAFRGGRRLGLGLLALLALLVRGAGAAEAPPARHPYNEYTWELNQLNPWLSACDLAGPAPADLQGSCGPPEAPRTCPRPCGTGGGGGAPGREQCLHYLEESERRLVCQGEDKPARRADRYRLLAELRLRHCCEHAALHALAPGPGGPLEAALRGGPACVEALDKLLKVDALAARLHCEFEEVLARYDCGQTYSVIHNCTHCKEAYRKWVCSSLVPYFAHGGPLDLEPSEESWAGRRIRPCRSLCQSVEQRCPYLLPGDRAPAYPTQYAGEPTFLCRDPNIPETGEQAARALHPISEDECCFNVCSEDAPALGICANCTGRLFYMGPKHPDPPTAPQCDISSLPSQQQSARSSTSLCSNIYAASMGEPYPQEPEPSAPPEMPSVVTVGSSSNTATSSTASPASSASSSTSPGASPLPLLCLFCVWGALFASQCSARRLLGLLPLPGAGRRPQLPLPPPRGPPVAASPRRPQRRRPARLLPRRGTSPGGPARAPWRGGRHCRWLWPCRWKAPGPRPRKRRRRRGPAPQHPAHSHTRTPAQASTSTTYACTVARQRGGHDTHERRGRGRARRGRAASRSPRLEAHRSIKANGMKKKNNKINNNTINND